MIVRGVVMYCCSRWIFWVFWAFVQNLWHLKRQHRLQLNWTTSISTQIAYISSILNYSTFGIRSKSKHSEVVKAGFLSLAEVAKPLTHWTLDAETAGKSISETAHKQNLISAENDFLQPQQMESFYTFCKQDRCDADCKHLAEPNSY